MILVSCPAFVPAAHHVAFDTLRDLVATEHADHPRLAGYLRIMRNTTVATRHFVRPPQDVLLAPGTRADPAARWRAIDATVQALREMAARAARQALHAENLAPEQIDCVIVSSVSGYVMPGLDVFLINDLGLRPDVRRIPQAQVGCVGGAWCLARAHEQLRLYPGSRVLVVASEAFSSVLSPADTTTDAMIYKALGGDGAAACIVHDDPSAGGLSLEAPAMEYLLPESEDYYRLTADEDALHFPSTKEAPLGAAKTLPELRRWLALDTERPWPLQFAICHNGAPDILTSVADGLLLTRDDLRQSWASLGEFGNMGSVSILDVLRRTYQQPPPPGSHGLMLAFGPGFAMIGIKVGWHGTPPEADA